MSRIIALLACMFAVSTNLFAQDDTLSGILSGYKDISSLTATVTCTQHKEVLTDDVVTRGKLYFKDPGRMCMKFSGTGDMLLMDNGVFTMVQDGRRSVAKGATLNQFETLVAVFSDLVLSTGHVSGDRAAIVSDRKGDRCVLTVTPSVGGGAKARRRLMFTSFVVTLDLKEHRVESLLMNGRGGDYVRYDFADFVSGVAVDDGVFNLPAL